MKYYEVKDIEGATLGVVSSFDFRKFEDNVLICSNKEEGQYIIMNNKLYRPLMLLNNPEPKEYEGMYPRVKVIQIPYEDYLAYKNAEFEEYLAKQNLH